MRFERYGDWIVAVSEIGAFESAVCNALLSLGSDVAFAGSQKDEEFRITGRANSQAVKAGIHLGDMFNRIAGECQGEGGGHDGAAGLTGIGETEALLDICMQNAASILKCMKKNHKRSEENVL
jgi:alanyl-tRNA synthetase